MRLARVGAALLVLGVWLPSPAGAADQSVSMVPGNTFDPKTVHIQVGDTVTWTNKDDTGHTVTSGNGFLDSGNLAPQASYSEPFTQAGTYAYYCEIHQSAMTGTVVVTGGPTPAPTPSPTQTGSPAPTLSPSPRVTRTLKPPSPSPSPPPAPAASPTPSPSPSPSPAASPTGEPSPTVTPTPTPSPSETIGATPASGGGPSAPQVIGIVGLVLAAGAGAALLWLRRRPGGRPPGRGGPPALF